MDSAYPEAVRPFLVREYPYMLARTEPITIGVFSVPSHILWPVAVQVARSLAPFRFYAHFVLGDELLVVFPSVIAAVRRGSAPDVERAQRVGGLFNIPVEQMSFGRLFEEDHPGGE
jgi:hypothetical protein